MLRLVAILVLLASCAPAEAPYRFTRFAMGTVVEYTIMARSADAAYHAMERAHAEIERVAALLGEQDSLSQIHRLNETAGRSEVDDETYAFLLRARHYHQASSGAFDVTIKPVLDLYDFESNTPIPPSRAEVAATLVNVGMARLTMGPSPYVDKPLGVKLAVGGIAKGYAVDRAVAVLREEGIRNALINAGGDLYCLGAKNGKPWKVGIRHPDHPDSLLEVLHLTDRAVATSGDYQRYFDLDGARFHHLLDPKTGLPASGVRSATVTAASAEEADALATAVFVLGAERGIALLDSLGRQGLVVDKASNRLVSGISGDGSHPFSYY